MSDAVGKWEQYLLLQQDPLISSSIPETKMYSIKNFRELINRYDHVYVKHNTTGQGRAIFKILKRQDGLYCYNGFTFQGNHINKCVSSITEFHQFLHPFLKFGRKSGPYVIQEGIESVTQNGQPFMIRVHVQLLEDEWLVGGMYGKIGLAEAECNGIVNSHRGAKVISINELLTLHLQLNQGNQFETIETINRLAISAAKGISSQFPRREYGMDFGLNKNGTPILFEVNTTPSIRSFAEIDNKAVWKNIVEIRKQQNKD
ncbi:Endospore coat-associated protein YheD [Neobacillus rhizosphaerae]|uniref:Endospore coat-associated protein YheD n=1 Tax=Neobacillus rhizosphaerae TaxID=2880965 RepID=A0ABN8KQH0_9BACI|nr:YheC/YheD family protein [Neobacillus rhizosphaerae]CAH2715961.1 Endospore coat-associated protein YheD [Neobacillus rhizosphaerae]